MRSRAGAIREVPAGDAAIGRRRRARRRPLSLVVTVGVSIEPRSSRSGEQACSSSSLAAERGGRVLLVRGGLPQLPSPLSVVPTVRPCRAATARGLGGVEEEPRFRAATGRRASRGRSRPRRWRPGSPGPRWSEQRYGDNPERRGARCDPPLPSTTRRALGLRRGQCVTRLGGALGRSAADPEQERLVPRPKLESRGEEREHQRVTARPRCPKAPTGAAPGAGSGRSDEGRRRGAHLRRHRLRRASAIYSLDVRTIDPLGAPRADLGRAASISSFDRDR